MSIPVPSSSITSFHENFSEKQNKIYNKIQLDSIFILTPLSPQKNPLSFFFSHLEEFKGCLFVQKNQKHAF